MNSNVIRFAALAAVFLSLCPVGAFAAAETARNLPPECTADGNTCGCPTEGDDGDKDNGTEDNNSPNDGDEENDECVKVRIGLGRSTPWTGSMSCSLKIFADNDSPMIFTADSLYAVLGGYTFKRLGTKNLSDGVTPAEVVMSRPNGEPIYFVFKAGESMARPDPGVHVKMDERLMMVDAEGWAVTGDPVYYDFYAGDGTKRRFLATDMTGALGKLVSITDARGVTVTPAEMGVDIVYDSNGVRQFLTPSRLADIVQHPGFTGYDVKVYAIADVPAKDSATGLYALPNAVPVKVFNVRRENKGKRAVVTVRRGGGDPQSYVYDYVMGDWSLTRPSGVEERKERVIEDERAAQVVKDILSSSGERLSRSEKNYKWESWGFAMTNKVEGFGGVTNVTEWTYYTSGNGKGKIKTKKLQSGLLTQYAYDSSDRVISETRSGPGMMTETTTYDYTPVDPSDPVLPVDTRPRTVVKKLNNIECERTYYVYSPLTNIVERVGTQGAAYGGTNALRTVTTFYPVTVGASVLTRPQAGFVASIRHENGKLDFYDYALSSNTWIRTVTHLHEQSPAPVSGKTTRDITITNARGEVVETRTEAMIDGIWYTIARNRMTYNAKGKRTSLENLAGQVTTTAWDCCHKVSETEPDGSTTTWDYDAEGRMIASSRLIPLDMINVTWLTTCYKYDALGRQVATWQTNYAAQVGLPVTRTRYDQLGRVKARVDQLGNTTTTTYSPDGRTVFVRNPNTSTRVLARSASGDVLSITGSAVTPEFHTYGIQPDGTRWSKTVQGETASSPRFTQRYENLLGQTIREERSGFQGAVLATTHSYDSLGRLISTVADYEPTTEFTYDELGNRIATARMVGRDDPIAPLEWRKNETLSSFVLADSIVWLTQTNIVSCSDSAIAPLVTSSARQLTGLTAALPSCACSTDVRGNVTESEMLVDSTLVTSRQTLPYATNKPLSVSRYGVSLMDVSVSAVTNTVAYDSLGRQIANTDGRGNTTHTEYNKCGQRSASIDALGNRTTYAYNQFGNLIAVTNPLGNAIVYEYDLRGRKTYEGGATYPVRYTYDIFGNKTTMMTYRNESLGPNSGDVTTWLYDIASGCMTNKVYADGKGPTYSYTPDGKLEQRIWARGIITDYTYDGWNNLTNTVYSDDTPTVSLFYDAMSRQTEAHDAAGATTFIYDSFGSLTNETVIGVAGTNTIERFWDGYGRTAGYALNGTRQTTIGYDPATARIVSMLANGSDIPFTWSYLPGTDLKSSLAYPNGLTSSWQYDEKGQLLQVCNATPANVISQYDYTYDAAGRRVARDHSGSAFDHADHIDYSYNIRNELTNAVATVDSDYRCSYKYDDIGNRICLQENTNSVEYVANNLNQYVRVSSHCAHPSLRDEFIPIFDDDGNQTIVKTATGIWNVLYNGENRPVFWSRGSNEIKMSFDRLGRRVLYNDGSVSEENNNHAYVYDDYVCVVSDGASDPKLEETECIIWDPTEIISPRALMHNNGSCLKGFYIHDADKNVSVEVRKDGELRLGTALTSQLHSAESSRVPNGIDFSCEFTDKVLGLTYYNFRHYNFLDGRWTVRDPIDETGGANLYAFCRNHFYGYDRLGLIDWPLFWDGAISVISGGLTVGGVILANCGAAAAAPVTGGASCYAAAAMDVFVVSWASMNIGTGIRDMCCAIGDYDASGPVQVAMTSSVVEMISGHPLSDEGLSRVYMSYYAIDMVSNTMSLKANITAVAKETVSIKRSFRPWGIFAIEQSEKHIKINLNIMACGDSVFMGTLDAYSLYSDVHGLTWIQDSPLLNDIGLDKLIKEGEEQ